MSGLFGVIRPAARSIAAASVWKSSVTALRPALGVSAIRMYGAAHGLTKQDVEARVLEVIKGFDKVDESKVAVSAHFIKDLGLDSLDTVELVMMFEEEFALDIPDADAEKIFTAEDAVSYILAHQ